MLDCDGRRTFPLPAGTRLQEFEIRAVIGDADTLRSLKPEQFADDQFGTQSGAPDQVFRPVVAGRQQAHDHALGAGDQGREARLRIGDRLSDGKAMGCHGKPRQ